uniref:Nucleoprotein n=1 Tax=Hantaviridae sp. TaxID=2809448 RepID=A0AAT9TSP5_9VIRU|nr:MAG: nucleocapsid protein [Hantaviridae sp.]
MASLRGGDQPLRSDLESVLKDLRDQEEQIKQEIAKKEAKIREAESKKPEDLDDGDKKLLQDRIESVVALKERLRGIQADIAAMAQQAKLRTIPKADDPRRKDMDPDDHLEQRSQLRYGNTIDLNDLNVDEPAGGSADWIKIIQYILPFPLVMVLKALYMITTRGRGFIKEHKGNRIRFRDDSSFEQRPGGARVPKHLFMSLATAQTSIQADEVTPGRFKTVVCGYYAPEIRARKLMSPVMGVIGFQYLADDWVEKIKEVVDATCNFMDAADLPDRAGQAGMRQPTIEDYLLDRAVVLRQGKEDLIEGIETAAYSSDLHLIQWITDAAAIWVFSCGPDRCPPSVLHIPGMAELGAYLALLQDIRNLIIASKLVGTSEEKLKKKSAFYQSYLRRTQSMGIQVDQRLVGVFLQVWGTAMVEHFHLGDDMDGALRKLAQSLIDRKVKEVSMQDPMKL